MEVEVTAMASRSCVTCGIHFSLTSRIWECDVCRDYILCENCFRGPLEHSEVLSAPPQAHHPDHPMIACDSLCTCNGCGSYPIWNLRWRCKVCPDFDLCEVCYGALDVANMWRSSGHLKEHPMIAIEVIHSDMLPELYPRFSKPVDSQWSYKIKENLPRKSGFKWVKREPLAKALGSSHKSVLEDDVIVDRLLKMNEDIKNHSPELEERMDFNHRSSFEKHVSKTNWIPRKHKIFLSHAGPQKDFVEQLNLDLSSVHHFGVFFDKDDESLPKGEQFSSKIFDAAKHCELAIVVLSDDYFCRKWPMLELAAFVRAQKERLELKILPLFYKLSVEEFKQPKRQQSYVRQWKKFLSSSINEDDIQEWKEALKVISRTNGLVYDRRMGEVTFRRDVVEAVCKRVKPDLVWDDSHVQGKLRLHRMIYENIQSLSHSCTSTLFMGLYGMGGCGKTTMCKVIGNQVMEQYLGQVCHIEFGSMDILQLLKRMLQDICSLKPSLVKRIDEGQALNLLKHHIVEKKVCLMIDNVLDDQAFLKEARILLNLPFLEGSLILVTSRSRMTLEKLNIKWGALMKIPSLTMVEAMALFLYHTGCDTSNLLEDQKKVMERFIDRCNFKVEDMVSREYHPLALKVLGTRAGRNPEEWVNVDIDFKYYENESKHDIFSILRLSYDNLISEYKEMFLGIALSRRNYFEGIGFGGMRWQIRCLYNKNDKQFVLNLVKVLQAKSLVEYYDVESGRLYIHDLYREFSLMEVENLTKLKHSSWCCFSCASNRDHFVQERRLRIYNQPTSHITEEILSCTLCSGAELLSIQGCPNLEFVDVPHMLNLKLFEIYGGCSKLRRVNLEGALNLRGLVWCGFEGDYPDLISLESLEILWLESYESQPPASLHGCLDFSRNLNLEFLRLTHLPLNLFNLNQAVLMKQLYLENCQHLERFEDLEALIKLEEVTLLACASLVEFPSLANFPSLSRVYLEGAAKLKQIHGFANLNALLKLSLQGCEELKELPGIEACTKLIELDLSGTSIIDCSWLSTMGGLTWVNLSSTKIRVLPDCSALCVLSQLWLEDCQLLESVEDNMGSICPKFPKSLQRFYVGECQNLHTMPQFHYGSALEYLTLNQTSVDDVSSVIYCQLLQELHCLEACITSLPDLSSLTRLEVLDVRGCELLTRMDNIGSLPALEKLYVSQCPSLWALPDLGSSTRLKVVSLRGCPMMNPNLVELPKGSTIGIEVEDVVTRQQENEDDAKESESQTILAVTNFEELELTHNLWRCVRLLDLVGMVGSWCGGLGGDEANAD